jgi:hypothetical protein
MPRPELAPSSERSPIEMTVVPRAGTGIELNEALHAHN